MGTPKPKFVRIGEIIGLYPKRTNKTRVPGSQSRGLVLLAALLLVLIWPQTRAITHVGLTLEEVRAQVNANTDAVDKIRMNVYSMAKKLGPVMELGFSSVLDAEIGTVVEDKLNAPIEKIKRDVSAEINGKLGSLAATIQNTASRINNLEEQAAINRLEIQTTKTLSLLMFLVMVAGAGVSMLVIIGIL